MNFNKNCGRSYTSNNLLYQRLQLSQNLHFFLHHFSRSIKLSHLPTLSNVQNICLVGNKLLAILSTASHAIILSRIFQVVEYTDSVQSSAKTQQLYESFCCNTETHYWFKLRSIAKKFRQSIHKPPEVLHNSTGYTMLCI